MGDGMPLKVTMRRADHLDMSDLSRLLDDVYSTGPASPPAAPPPAPAPAAEPDLPWATDESMDEAFADWVPGPGADAPQAERDLFELADVDDAPAAQATSVLQHRFVADTDSLGDLAAPATLADALGDVADLPVAEEEPIAPFAALDVFEDEVPSPAPEVLSFAGPVPDDEPVSAARTDAFEPTVALTDLFVEAEAPTPPAPVLAYEPPATLAEALAEAPDELPAALVVEEADEWPLAGLAPVRPAPEVELDPGALSTTWRREHDDLLPARGRRR